MQVGDVTAWERTFTQEDVIQFGQISGDQGIHHVAPDEQGRLMVQGLLTATLPTKLGGDLNFIARQLTFEFLRPVFTGDTIRCESTITQLEQDGERIRMSTAFACRNQHGKEVLKGSAYGVILNPAR
ncbi:MAG: enoyl-CoA hydratase [Ktedonobacteraceae bacterium]|nr:enoyl-CoA hydratase [Ktedonobacteraceae bacterium]MBO0791530.1 enoyl-CoA hydratase [Ktedonobacteraceae bacterium]